MQPLAPSNSTSSSALPQQVSSQPKSKPNPAAIPFLKAPDNPEAGDLTAKLGEQYPADQFTKHEAAQNGNCMFSCIAESIEGNTPKVGSDGLLSEENVGNLRGNVAKFIQDNPAVIDTMLNSYSTIATSNPAELAGEIAKDGSWSGDNGDLFLTLAAHVTGREVLVFTEEGADEGKIKLIGGAASFSSELSGRTEDNNTKDGQLPILLKKKNTTTGTSEHYDLLSVNISTTPRTASSDKTPTLEKAVKPYLPAIEKELLGGEKIDKASPKQLADGVKKLEEHVNGYESAVLTSSNNSKGLKRAKAKIKKHKIENMLTANDQTQNLKGRKKLLKAATLIHAKLAKEVQSRGNNNDNNINIAKDGLARITKKLEGTTIVDSIGKAEISKAVEFRDAGTVEKSNFVDDRIDAVAKPYEKYIEAELLGETTLNEASAEDLLRGLKKLESKLDTYSSAVQDVDNLSSKKKWYKGQEKDTEVNKKHTLENDLPNIGQTKGRLGAMKKMSIMYMRLASEKERLPASEGLEDVTKALDDISGKLKKPGFKIDNHSLVAELKKLGRSKVGEEKSNTMAGYMGTMSDSLGVLASSEQAAGAKKWQSPKLNKIVSNAQKELSNLKDKASPSMTAVELTDLGIKANNILKKTYTDIATHADKEMKGLSLKKNPNRKALLANVSEMGALRDVATLAAQHHQSNSEIGKVAKAVDHFKESVPRHAHERIATAPTTVVSTSGATTASANLGVGGDITVASLRGDIGITRTKSVAASVSRANDGNLFSRVVNTVSNSASATFQADLGNLITNDKVGLTADVKGTMSKSTTTGLVALAGSPEAAFGSHHSPELLNGKSAGNGIGKFTKLTAIDDIFSTQALKGISAASLKVGYNNDNRIKEGLENLVGNNDNIAYGKSEQPQGKLFSQSTLNESGVAAKGVMSELFPDPLWESIEFTSTTKRKEGAGSARASLDIMGDVSGSASVNMSVSKSSTDTSRIVRSAKLPHQIFSPGLTLNEDRAVGYAKKYFSAPTNASKTISEPLAKAVGFDNSGHLHQAISHSLTNPNPKGGDLIGLDANNVNTKELVDSYKSFDKSVNTIDQFFHQPDTALRHAMLDDTKEAISHIKDTFGAIQLPNIDNVDEPKVSDKKGYTEEYQAFQDTSVAILTNFSAMGGAMKLIADQKNSGSDKDTLKDASSQLLGAIENRSLPWNNKEMTNRSTFVRQVQATPFAHTENTTITHSAKVSPFNLEGGNYDITRFTADGITIGDEITIDKGDAKDALPTGNSQGFGVNSKAVPVTRTVSTSVDEVPDNNTDPGQTGVTTTKTTTLQELSFGTDITDAGSLKKKTQRLLLNALASKSNVNSRQLKVKTQAYPQNPPEKMGNPDKSDRAFTAYQADISIKSRDVSAKIGTGNLSFPGSLATANVGVTRTQGKDDFELNSFTYGNDVGALAIIGDKLFKDHGLNIPEIQEKIADSEAKGEAITVLDDLDDRFTKGLVGNKQYDHMSAVVSKFRNAGIIEKDGKIEVPTVSGDGAATVSDEIKDKLHTSKGDNLDLTDNSEGKKYTDRAGFFGYSIARYDDSFTQDAYKNYKSFAGNDGGTEFPDALAIDKRLSKAVPDGEQHKDINGTGIDQTRQQWLKAATPDQRQEFYQNDSDGKEMLVDYLKVLAFSASLNDITFQNNSLQMEQDKGQVSKVDTLFKAPQEVPLTSAEKVPVNTTIDRLPTIPEEEEESEAVAASSENTVETAPLAAASLNAESIAALDAESKPKPKSTPTPTPGSVSSSDSGLDDVSHLTIKPIPYPNPTTPGATPSPSSLPGSSFSTDSLDSKPSKAKPTPSIKATEDVKEAGISVQALANLFGGTVKQNKENKSNSPKPMSE